MSKILIIDDSATILAVLAAAVRAMKFQPLMAESGEAGLQLSARCSGSTTCGASCSRSRPS